MATGEVTAPPHDLNVSGIETSNDADDTGPPAPFAGAAEVPAHLQIAFCKSAATDYLDVAGSGAGE